MTRYYTLYSFTDSLKLLEQVSGIDTEADLRDRATCLTKQHAATVNRQQRYALGRVRDEHFADASRRQLAGQVSCCTPVA